MSDEVKEIHLFSPLSLDIVEDLVRAGVLAAIQDLKKELLEDEAYVDDLVSKCIYSMR